MTEYGPRTRSRVLHIESEAENYISRTLYPGTCTVQPPPLQVSTVRNASYVTNLIEETTTDVVTEKFVELRNKGHVINNPFTKVHRVQEWPLLTFSGGCTAETYGCTPLRWYTTLDQVHSGAIRVTNTTWQDQFWCQVPDFSEEISQATDLAVSEAWASIGSDQMLALVSIMEGEKTLRGILDTALRIKKFLRNIKKLQSSEIRKVLKTGRNIKLRKEAWREIREEFSFDALCDRYMEVRYGWRPLYYDLMGAMKAFKAEFTKLRQTFRGFEEFTRSGTNSFIWDHSMQTWCGTKQTYQQTWNVDVKVRAGVLCDVDLSQMDPWGFSKIPESILDLTPYSFIADWFFNISDTLSSWTPDLGFKVLASWVKVTKITTQSTSLGNAQHYMTKVQDSTHRSSGLSNISMPTATQVVVDTVRTPNPRREIIPTCKLRLNAAKLTDLAIILKGLLYGGKVPLKSRNLRV